MSYDLYIDGGKKLDKKSFANHFKGRANYKVSKQQAIYENEDTAVHFIFDAPEEGIAPFNLNYFRPHVFGLEAAIELQAFADAFGATVVDPQGDDGEEPGPFNREKFLKAWNDGNQFAYKSLLKEQDEPVYTWPSKQIREIWDWNYGRPPNENRVVDDMFVPGIFAVASSEGQALTVAIWPPECPVLLPQVDFVLVPVGQTGKESEDTALASWQEILPVLAPYQDSASVGLARYRLGFETWPPEIAAFLSQKREPVGQLDGIGLDQILDREMIEAAS
jgi:hypothetical protein